jgi:hypothetical protein
MPKLGIMCMTSAATRISCCPALKRRASFVPGWSPLIESRKAPVVERSLMRAATRVAVSSMVWHSTSTTL